MMQVGVIETNTSNIWLDEFGVLRVIKKEGSREELDDAEENIDAIIKLCNGKGHPAFIDLTAITNQTHDAIEYYSKMATEAKCYACAFLVGNMQSTAIGRQNLSLIDPDINRSLFTSRELADEWLFQFVK